ncbi:hypothetical protein HGRIS_003504 [Hohenbuehelia grisea]|uniref:AB hydrolase-1 domain-containing protein n=1 Tax=Hohenbuehelia grisea TaxID=104357 RepID=A0ABR3JGK5_9AGAR
MEIEHFVFQRPLSNSGCVLNIVANRYRPSNVTSASGLTLILTHGAAYHKEHWEPTLEQLFKFNSSGTILIREAWSFDWPNHGDAGVLNASIFAKRPDGIREQEFSAAIIDFMASGYVTGHQLVGIGHSLGSTATLFTAVPMPDTKMPISAVILVDPVLAPKDIYDAKIKHNATKMISQAISTRRDTWDSREAAYNQLKKRMPWKAWDDAVLLIYVNHGLRSVPSAETPGNSSVTLKCNKDQELSVWRFPQPTFDILTRLDAICSRTPVHVILGERADVIPSFVHKWLEDSYSGLFATMRRVPGVGHNIPQENPILLASAISSCLQSTFSGVPRAAL